jgi:hypothetical protein
MTYAQMIFIRGTYMHKPMAEMMVASAATRKVIRLGMTPAMNATSAAHAPIWFAVKMAWN